MLATMQGMDIHADMCCQLKAAAYAGKISEPEIFPRADGTVWCCGENSMVTAPETASQVQPKSGAADAIQVQTAFLCACDSIVRMSCINDEWCMVWTSLSVQ